MVKTVVETDPQNNEIDARKIIPLPTVVGVSPSQVISPQQAVGVGYHRLKFSVNESIGIEKSCFVSFTVRGLYSLLVNSMFYHQKIFSQAKYI